MNSIYNPTRIILPIDTIPIIDWASADQTYMDILKNNWKLVNLKTPLKTTITYHRDIKLIIKN
jgi:hypothetical protein